jgi:hypothetical protein
LSRSDDRKGPVLNKPLSFIVLVVTIAICYFPSLYHMPRSDQIAYLAEMAGKNDFHSLVSESFDLSRTRQFNRGDAILFRPGLYCFLGVEKYVFGYNFFLWQLTGILLHIGVVVLLYKFLLNIRRGWGAFALSAFFATALVPMEMVIWNHVNAYMIFVMAVLIALDQIETYFKESQRQARRLVVVFGSLLIACFMMELGAVFTVLMFIYFSMKAPTEKNTSFNKALIACPALVYLGCYVYNWSALKLHPFASEISGFGSFRLFINFLATHLFLLFYGLFPGQLICELRGRTFFLIAVEHFNPLNIVSVILVMTFGYLVRGRLTKVSLFKDWHLPQLLFWMIFSFALAVCMGRVMPRGLDELMNNPYYCYIYWVFLIPLLYSCISLTNLNVRWSAKYLIIVCLGILIGAQVYLNCSMNYIRAAYLSPTRKLVQVIEDLKAVHRTDRRFSFYVSVDSPGNFPIGWLKKSGDPIDKTYSYIEALYLDCFDPVHPMVSQQELYAYLAKHK